EQICQSRSAGGTIAIGIVFPPLHPAGYRFVTQPEFPFIRAHLDDLELGFVAQFESMFHILTVGFLEFRYVTQAFQALIQLDENPKRSVANDAAANQVADTMIREELFPHIRLQLLYAKRQPMVVAIDIQDHGFDAFSFFQYLRRMLDSPRRNVGNVDKPIDSLFDFNESAKVGEIPNSAADHRSDRVTLSQGAPWIGLGLFESQRNPAILEVDVQDDGFDILSDMKHLGRMLDAVPRQNYDMQQPIDSAQNDEYALIRNVFHDAANFGILPENFQCEGFFPRLLVLQHQFS